MNIKVSFNELNNFITKIEQQKKNVSKVAIDVADTLANNMLDEVKDKKAYGDTYKIETTFDGNTAISGIQNDEPKAYFNEYGTGIVGKANPHISEVLTEIGWEYDYNNHGEKGWWYPTDESDPNPYKSRDKKGQLRGWTRGLSAKKEFYNALQKAKKDFPDVAEKILKEM